VDAIFINRILPKDVNLSFFDEWLPLQSSYINELEQVFGTIPLFKIKWYDEEITGMRSLDRLTKDVLTDDSGLAILTTVRNEEYEKTEEGYLLKVYLPCVKKQDLILHETGTDVVIRIGNFKRSIPLPNALRRFQVTGAKIVDDYLNIRFAPGEGGSVNE
jgi:arsenite-transporting ATPase